MWRLRRRGAKRRGGKLTRSRLDRHARTRLRRRRRPRQRSRRRRFTESNSGHLAARAGNGAGRKLRKKETAREGNGEGTGDIERAHALTSGPAASNADESECTLVANSSSPAGGARDVNNLSRAGRAEFSALGDVMRAVSGICPRGARVHMLVHSVTRSLNRCTRAMAKQDDVVSGATATHKFSCDVASGASATHKFSCDVAVCSSPKFFWTSAARDATAKQYTRWVVAALLLTAMLAGAASACCWLRAGLRRSRVALTVAPCPPYAVALH